jgi:hypothetical protein
VIRGWELALLGIGVAEKGCEKEQGLEEGWK